MPRDAAGGVPRRPLAPGERRAVRRLAEDVEHRGAKGLDGGAVGGVGLLLAQPHLAGVVPLRLDDVADHLVAIATATSRALAQLSRSRLGCFVEDPPDGLEDAD